VCSTEGRLFDLKGKTLDELMYVGGCLFVDLAANFVHVEFQSKLKTLTETRHAKDAFEDRLCPDHGVVFVPHKAITGDNESAFTSNGFSASLYVQVEVEKFGQRSLPSLAWAHLETASLPRG